MSIYPSRSETADRWATPYLFPGCCLPLSGVPTAPAARHVRSAANHVAGRAPEHVRGEAGPQERYSLQLGPLSSHAGACAPLRCSAFSSHRPLPSGAVNNALREPASAGSSPHRPHPQLQVGGQTPRDLPASRARLPPSMAPSNAPGIARRPSSPPRPQRRRAGGRARVPPKAGLVARVRARKRPSYLGELHHDGGRGRRRRAWRASSSQKSELSGTRRKWTAVAGGEGSGARTTACQLQLASEAKD